MLIIKCFTLVLLEIISENCVLLYPPYQTVFRGFESENCLYIKDNVALLFLISTTSDI